MSFGSWKRNFGFCFFFLCFSRKPNGLLCDVELFWIFYVLEFCFVALGIGRVWNLCEVFRFCLLGRFLVGSSDRVEFWDYICWLRRFSICLIQLIFWVRVIWLSWFLWSVWFIFWSDLWVVQKWIGWNLAWKIVKTGHFSFPFCWS